jgi:hypothetical protein
MDIKNAAQTLGRRGGALTKGLTSRAKAQAARENGKKGGRPPLYADVIDSPKGRGSCDWPECQTVARYAVYTRRRGLRHYCDLHVSLPARRVADDPTRRGIPRHILS